MSNVVAITEARKARRTKAAAPKLDELFAEDLARSGLVLTHARKAGYRLGGPDELWRVLRPKSAERADDFTAEGYEIPYFTPDGKRMPFSRVRKLRGRWRDKDDGSQRYASPANSMPHLYVPVPLFDWLPEDGGKILVKTLAVTEGEKKALKACVSGIPSAALGGVDSFRSARHGVLLLEEFGWFDLSATAVSIVYDSDAYQNPDVDRALRAFSDALRRHASPKSVSQRRLTSENAGAKTGLDDFLAQFPSPAKARAAFEELASKEDQVSEAFATFNREIAHVRRKTRYFNIDTRVWYPSQKQVTEEYGRGSTVADPGGKEFLPISKWFTERPPETEVLDVIYAPGKPERYASADGLGEILNTWRPGPLLHTKFKRLAQVAPFIEYVTYLTPGLTQEERDWLLDWCAHPIRSPGAKLMTSVLVWSTGNGTGKNTLGRILFEIYGASNTFEINGTTFGERFNDWAQRQFVMANEVRLPSFQERAAVMSRLKTLITEPTIDMETKGLPRWNAPNVANFYLNSNFADALPLEDDDRRFFVVRGPDVEDKWTQEKFKKFWGWLKSGGFEIVYGYMLARDTRSFDPYAQAPRTAARAEMLVGNNSPFGDLVAMLAATPVSVLGMRTAKDGTLKHTPPGKDLFLPYQVVEALQLKAETRNQKMSISIAMLASALARHAHIEKRTFEMQRGGVRKAVTAYAFFNPDRWANAKDREWRAHLLEHNEGLFS